VILNGKKIKCTTFSPTTHAANTTSPYAVFSVAGKNIENVRQWHHLSHLSSASRTDTDDITENTHDFFRQVIIICSANFAILTCGQIVNYSVHIALASMVANYGI
jgi:hypothetical protein